jgi:hypothetical protein
MKTPTSGAVETDITQAPADGRGYGPIQQQVTPFVIRSSSGITPAMPAANVIVHGVVAPSATITIPYNREKEDRRTANRIANSPSVASGISTATPQEPSQRAAITPKE